MDDEEEPVYRHRRPDDAALRARLKDLASERRRFGYRRLNQMLKREGTVVNLKKVRRLYAEARLQVRRRKGRKKASGTRAPLVIPQAPNQRWSLDFVSDVFAFGRRFRVLAVIDDFSAECLCLTEAHALLSCMGYREEPDALRWQTVAEARNGAHIPPMQVLSLPVSVELHRRMLASPADDLALRDGCNLQPLALSDGTSVLVPDPASRLAHSFIHSQVSHRMGVRRLVNLRHLHEFGSLAYHYRADLAVEAIHGSVDLH